MAGNSASISTGSRIAVQLDGALAAGVQRQARRSGEPEGEVVAKAVRRFLAQQQGVPAMPSPEQVKRLFDKMRKADAGDDWQDYADWPE